ncbi:hypothetical protein GBA52_007688 [Prunus armeniaca]|nr:hypothetical protein GBA52_007688 [Prunus armeniaca]
MDLNEQPYAPRDTVFVKNAVNQCWPTGIRPCHRKNSRCITELNERPYAPRDTIFLKNSQ